MPKVEKLQDVSLAELRRELRAMPPTRVHVSGALELLDVT